MFRVKLLKTTTNNNNFLNIRIMKKTIMLLAGALMLMGSASAQNTAESLFKSGKAAFAAYDKDLGTMQVTPDKVDKDQMAANLLQGFADFEQALPLDSVKQLNKDGSLKKIKTKYSKDIVSIMCSHISDLLTVGDNFYQAQKNAEAANVYGKYCSLIKSPMALENKVPQPADTIMGQILFMKGLCEYNIPDDLAAFQSFDQSMKYGFTGKLFNVNTGDYKAACLARHLQTILDSKDYAKAYSLLEGAIAAEPANATYQCMLGDVYTNDSTKTGDEALNAYKKAVELNPKYPDALYRAGHGLWKKVQDYLNAHPDATNEQAAPIVVPLYEEALGYLERAKENGQSGTEAFIDNIKYGLDFLKKK